MTQYEAVKKLEESGWKFKEKCTCGGIFQLKYINPQKPGIQVTIMPRHDKLLIHRFATVLHRADLDQLTEKLALV